MAEAFSSLLKVWDRGDLSDIPIALIIDEILVSLFQVLFRTLMTQNVNGSWGSSNSREVTAYAILTISKASALPFAVPIQAQIESAIAAGQDFLYSINETGPSYLWVEKVTYGSVVLVESYVLAALNASSKVQWSLSSNVNSLVTIPSINIKRLSYDCFGSSAFGSAERWKCQAAFIEGSLFSPYLQRLVRKEVNVRLDDRAFKVIPFAWAACNYHGRQPLTTSNLRQKIGSSLLEHLEKRSLKTVSSGEPTTNGASHITKLVSGDSSHDRSNGIINGHKLVNSHSKHNNCTPTVNGVSKHISFTPAVNGTSEHQELNSKITGYSKHEKPTMLTNGHSNGLEVVGADIIRNAKQACDQALEAAPPSGVALAHVPHEHTYQLPDTFTGDLSDTFLKGMTTSNNSMNTLSSSSIESVFTSYDDDLARIVGSNVLLALSQAFLEAALSSKQVSMFPRLMKFGSPAATQGMKRLSSRKYQVAEILILAVIPSLDM